MVLWRIATLLKENLLASETYEKHHSQDGLDDENKAARRRVEQLAGTVTTGLFMPGHCALDSSPYAAVQRGLHGRSPLPARRHPGAFLPRSSFPRPGLQPDLWERQRPAITTITHGRIGLWLISGSHSSLTEWVELDLNGTVLGLWPVDKTGEGVSVAMTADDQMYLQQRD
jgi:hypothetical protein